MTKFERATIYISCFALLTSLVTPVVTYFWLDASNKEYQQKGRFVITAFDYYQIDEQEKQAARKKRLRIEAMNIGKRPAEGVTIVVAYKKEIANPNPNLNLTLPSTLPISTKNQGNAMFYLIDRSIAPNDTVSMFVVDTFSESGDISNISICTKNGDCLELYQRPTGFGGGTEW